jgi:hypothetical protein
MRRGRAKFQEAAVARVFHSIGRVILRYLEKPARDYAPFTPSDPVALRQSLEPGGTFFWSRATAASPTSLNT